MSRRPRTWQLVGPATTPSGSGLTLQLVILAGLALRDCYSFAPNQSNVKLRHEGRGQHKTHVGHAKTAIGRDGFGHCNRSRPWCIRVAPSTRRKRCRLGAGPDINADSRNRQGHVTRGRRSHDRDMTPKRESNADRWRATSMLQQNLVTDLSHEEPVTDSGEENMNRSPPLQERFPRTTRSRSPVASDRVDMAVSRRQLLGAFGALGTAAVVMGGSSSANAVTSTADGLGLDEMLVWSPRSEIMKRAPATGGGVAPITNETYPVRFVTYLARFLLNYDAASRQLWEKKASNIPMDFSTMEVEAVRRDQFAEFAKAVQVGLLDYQGPQGIKAFFSLMRSRYGQGEDCKRQLAILFSFLEEGQPTELIEGLLGEVDNGGVSSMVITDPGGGYTGSVPLVTISSSQAGKTAKARAVVRETGHLVGIRLPPDCEYRYSTPPTVRVSAPADATGVQAEARAVLDRRKGFITAIQITNPGAGYSSALEPVTVEVFGEDNFDESGDFLVESVLRSTATASDDGVTCQSNFVAEAIIDREVGAIEILEQGDGYATSVPLSVEIQAPEECGGRPGGTQAFAVGLVSTGVARDDSKTSLPVPGTSVTSKLAQMLPTTVSDTLTINEKGRYESLDLTDLPSTDGVGKAGNARSASAMFDPVFGPVGRSPLEKESVLTIEDYLKLATAGAACNALVRFFLHPLDCVKTTVQAEMSMDAGSEMSDVWDEGGRELEDDAGEKGGSGWVATVKGIIKKGGVGELLRGIDVSTLLGFMLGFIGFGGTEFFRRELERMMEMVDGSSSTPVGIILTASALAQLVSCIITCPVEAVRIRVMTCDKRPEFLSFVGTAKEMLDEKGVLYFWSGLLALLFRELPFAIAKFLTFELVRDKIFEELPAAQESVFTALVVSIVAGMTAGVAGAFVSQPADTVLTRLNTTRKPATQAAPLSPIPARRQPWDLRPSVVGAVGVRSGVLNGNDGIGGFGGLGRRTVGLREKEGSDEVDDGGGDDDRGQTPDWKEVVRDMFEGDGGVMNLFSGVGLRAVFFGAAIALQFFAFDYFKALLKVSPDDLKLVLDVFADRVSFYSGGGQEML